MKYTIVIVTLLIALCASMAFAAQTKPAKAGKYTVEYAMQPTPPTVGNNQITITVKDGEKPLTGAEVSLHLDMVGMSMSLDAKTTPGAQEGQYVTTVDLAMAGAWTLDVNVQAMAGMVMDGDGKTSFNFTVEHAKAGSTSTPIVPVTPPAPSDSAPSGLFWPITISVLAVIGIVIVIIIVRGRMKGSSSGITGC